METQPTPTPTSENYKYTGRAAWESLPQMAEELNTIANAKSFDDGAKMFLKSKTMMGAVAALIGFILQYLDPQSPVSHPTIYNDVSVAFEVLGLFMIFFGRVNAEKKIMFSRPKRYYQ